MKLKILRSIMKGCLFTGVLFFGGGTLLLYLTWPELSLEAVQHCSVSPGVYDHRGEPLRIWPSPEGDWSLPVSLDQMGEWLPRIAVAVEDGRFYSHGGVDLLALLRATVQNLFAGEVVSGGSTITSQLVRLTLPRSRTLQAKLDEFRQAWEMERHFSKEEILELYLNKAYFGGMLRGVEAASLGWYGKSSKNLSPGEAALLVGLLKGPTAYRPDRNPRGAKARRDAILTMLFSKGMLDETAYGMALEEPLPERMLPFPALAPLASERLRRENPEKSRIYATLDRAIQEELQRIGAKHAAQFGSPITLAALVVENASGSLRGALGNARWGENTPGSWIDCTRVLRSPGSALKPFVYAAAFDRGYLTPDSLMADTPYGFGGRHPRNFDRIFRGPVSAGEALSLSLNVPAVRVLRMIRGNVFLSLLRRLGFSGFTKDSSHYGDALVLGGCEVTLEELVRAYGVFASGGRLPFLAWLSEESESSSEAPLPGERIYSSGAAFLINLCLSRPERLPVTTQMLLAKRQIQICLKTGTSYGMRDAWTVAYTPEYTLGVWVGDPGGSPLEGVAGIRAAAPVAVEMLLSLTEEASWFLPPEDISRREICVLSGQPPGEACAATSMGWYIPGVSSGKSCTLHRREGGEMVLRWPRELRGYERGGTLREASGKLTIISPRENLRIFTLPERNEKIPLRTEGGVPPYYWYVNGIYQGKQEEGEEPCFWSLKEGTHRLSVTDGEGQTHTIRFTVE
jgi:penicillin-binding protein 1C